MSLLSSTIALKLGQSMAAFAHAINLAVAAVATQIRVGLIKRMAMFAVRQSFAPAKPFKFQATLSALPAAFLRFVCPARVFWRKLVTLWAMCFQGIQGRWARACEHVFAIRCHAQVIGVCAACVFAQMVNDQVRWNRTSEQCPSKAVHIGCTSVNADFPITEAVLVAPPNPTAIGMSFQVCEQLLPMIDVRMLFHCVVSLTPFSGRSQVWQA